VFSLLKKLRTDFAIPIALVAAVAFGGPLVVISIRGDEYHAPPPNSAEQLIISDGFGVGTMVDVDGDTMMIAPIDIMVAP
jgi:hypothetical protein